jgi:hypothetical protein
VHAHPARHRAKAPAHNNRRPAGSLNCQLALNSGGQERATIRQAGADDARRSRARQGPSERIEDPATVTVLDAILRDARAPPLRESADRERKPTA